MCVRCRVERSLCGWSSEVVWGKLWDVVLKRDETKTPQSSKKSLTKLWNISPRLGPVLTHTHTHSHSLTHTLSSAPTTHTREELLLKASGMQGRWTWGGREAHMMVTMSPCQMTLTCPSVDVRGQRSRLLWFKTYYGNNMRLKDITEEKTKAHNWPQQLEKILTSRSSQQYNIILAVFVLSVQGFSLWSITSPNVQVILKVAIL